MACSPSSSAGFPNVLKAKKLLLLVQNEVHEHKTLSFSWVPSPTSPQWTLTLFMCTPSWVPSPTSPQWTLTLFMCTPSWVPSPTSPQWTLTLFMCTPRLCIIAVSKKLVHSLINQSRSWTIGRPQNMAGVSLSSAS